MSDINEILKNYDSSQLTDEMVDGFIKDNTDNTFNQERLERIWKRYNEKLQREKTCSKCLFALELCVCPFRFVQEDV